MSADHLFSWAHVNQTQFAAAALLGGAAVVLLSPGRTLGWCLALLAAATALAAATSSAVDTLVLGRGGGLFHDGAAAFAAPLLALNVFCVILGGGGLVRDQEQKTTPFTFALILAAGGGWMGALLAARLSEMFLWIQVSSLAGIALTALAANQDRAALNGSLRMFSACGAAAALMLLGVGLVERGTGTDALQDLPLAHAAAPEMGLLGVGLLLISVAWTAGLAPLNTWGGLTYARTSRLGALVLGAVHTIGAIAVLVRIAGFALQAPAIAAGVATILAGIGAAALLAGSIQAMGAASVNRLAAFCIAANAGSVLIAAALGSNAGFSAAFVQMVALSGTACALFCSAAIAPRGHADQLGALDGLVRRSPIASVALASAVLSAMGAPLTIGFLSRWRVMEAAMGAEWWWIMPTMVAGSLAAVFYGGRLIERMFLRRAAEVRMERPDLTRALLVPGAIAGISLIFSGAAPGFLLSTAALAADIVMGGAP